MALTDDDRERREGRRRWVWLLLLLLLLLFAAWWYADQSREPAPVVDNGSVRANFRGCDSAGRCATFRLIAPGFDYSWTFGRATVAPIDGARPDLARVIADEMSGARGLIAAGLASREGDGGVNRRLSACRSLELADVAQQAMTIAGVTLPLYRITLGRYEESVLTAGGQPLQTERDTRFERLIVLGLIVSQDQGVDLDQALKDGLENDLPEQIVEALRAGALLDFTRYACWSDEFRVTPAGTQRRVCYDETRSSPQEFCSGF